MIKVVFLDAEGTFLKFTPSLGRIYFNLWKEYGIQIEEKEIEIKMRENYKKIFKKKLNGLILNGELCRKAWREIFEETFSTFSSFPFFGEVFERAYSFFGTPDCVEVVPEFYSFLKEAKASEIKLAIISNWDKRLYSVLEGHNLLSQFDAIFLGCDIGYLKPHEEIFKGALNYFKVNPSEALMIGDSWEDDIEPAQKLGIPFFYVKDLFPTFDQIKHHLKVSVHK